MHACRQSHGSGMQVVTVHLDAAAGAAGGKGRSGDEAGQSADGRRGLLKGERALPLHLCPLAAKARPPSLTCSKDGMGACCGQAASLHAWLSTVHCLIRRWSGSCGSRARRCSAQTTRARRPRRRPAWRRHARAAALLACSRCCSWHVSVPACCLLESSSMGCTSEAAAVHACLFTHVSGGSPR